MTEVYQDRELLRLCVQGEDVQAWEAFVQKYSPVIWSTVQKTFRSHFYLFRQEDAEDLFNSVFLSLIENDFSKLKQYRGDNSCSLKTWLSVVTSRMAIDYMRRDRSRLEVVSHDEDTDIIGLLADRRKSAQDALEEKEARSALEEAVNGLEQRDRLIFRLLCQGTSPEGIANLLGISADSVYSRKNRIIGKLKKTLSGMQENGSPLV